MQHISDDDERQAKVALWNALFLQTVTMIPRSKNLWLEDVQDAGSEQQDTKIDE